jgi:thioredoxin-related protein
MLLIDDSIKQKERCDYDEHMKKHTKTKVRVRIYSHNYRAVSLRFTKLKKIKYISYLFTIQIRPCIRCNLCSLN